jgi:acetyltransferase-like isoleucine patch superfamily enzyme
MSSFYSVEELATLGLKSYGSNVLISRKASLYSPDKLSLGDHVRIDDFTILSGDICIGNRVHIAAFCALYGTYGIEIQDFCGISARGTIYSAVDDFSGEFLTGPMVDAAHTCHTKGRVVLERFVQLGANSLVFPGVTLPEGTATGAFTLVNKNTLDAWTLYTGIPATPHGPRRQDLKTLAKQYGSYTNFIS